MSIVRGARRELGLGGAIIAVVVILIALFYSQIVEPQIAQLSERLDRCEEGLGDCNDFVRRLLTADKDAAHGSD